MLILGGVEPDLFQQELNFYGMEVLRSRKKADRVLKGGIDHSEFGNYLCYLNMYLKIVGFF